MRKAIGIGTHLVRPGFWGVYRVIDVFDFDDKRWFVCKCAVHMPCIECFGPDTDLSTWERSTASAFDAVMVAVGKTRARERREAERRNDAMTYGVKVQVSYGGWVGTNTIVRCTSTRWVSIDGRAFKRSHRPQRNGSGIGNQRGRITDASLADLDAFVGNRERVDIVAERKAAAGGAS